MGKLKKLVPTSTELFLPTFTTTTNKSVLAHSIAFADCVSSYYGFFMYGCGIPSIDIKGTIEDWVNMKSNWIQMAEVLHLSELVSEKMKYYQYFIIVLMMKIIIIHI